MGAWPAATVRPVSVALVLLLSMLAACSPRTTTVLKPTTTGETSYKLITPPDAPHYALQPGQSASLPAPVIGRFAPPVYPASLVKPGAGPVTLRAQLVFGADGHVTGVYMLPGSYAGPGHALFENAVRTAARDWRFTPLVFEHYVRDGDAPAKLEQAAKPFSLWFAFQFRVVDGKPVVETVKR